MSPSDRLTAHGNRGELEGEDVAEQIQIRSLEDATFWIRVHQRYAIQDVRRLNQLGMRLRALEAPWWRPFERRRLRRWAREM